MSNLPAFTCPMGYRGQRLMLRSGEFVAEKIPHTGFSNTIDALKALGVSARFLVDEPPMKKKLTSLQLSASPHSSMEIKNIVGDFPRWPDTCVIRLRVEICRAYGFEPSSGAVRTALSMIAGGA